MNIRRARTLRTRAVLRARRKGFLTPEARWEASLPVHYGAAQQFHPSHIRLTPSDGGAAVVIAAEMRGTILPRMRMYPDCPRVIGAWIDVDVISGEPLAAFDAVKTLRGARTVRVEAWAHLTTLRPDTWVHLTVPDVYDITWGPGNVSVGHEGFTFDLLDGHTNAEWCLELRTDDPAETTTGLVVVAFRWDGHDRSGRPTRNYWCAECNEELHGDAGDADQELTAADVEDGAVCDVCLRSILTRRLTT